MNYAVYVILITPLLFAESTLIITLRFAIFWLVERVQSVVLPM